MKITRTTLLPSIHNFFICRDDCRACNGTGHVCEDHLNLPWGGVDPAGCDCGAPGMPCLLIKSEAK